MTEYNYYQYHQRLLHSRHQWVNHRTEHKSDPWLRVAVHRIQWRDCSSAQAVMKRLQ